MPAEVDELLILHNYSMNLRFFKMCIQIGVDV